jgi:hypothetical protein
MDPSTRGASRDGAGVHWEFDFDCIVNVTRRTVYDRALDPAPLSGVGEDAAPTSGINARSLFNKNDTAGTACIYCGSA